VSGSKDLILIRLDLIHWYILNSKCPLYIMMLRLKGQRLRGEIGHRNILTTQYLENPLLDRVQSL
jgi:hypothetical protein